MSKLILPKKPGLLIARRALLAAPALLLANHALAQVGQIASWPPKAIFSGGGAFGPIDKSAAASVNNNNVSTTLNSTGANFIVAAVGSYNPGGAFTVTDLVGGNNNGAPTACTSVFNGHGDRAQILFWLNPTFTGASHQITVSGTGVYPTVWAASFAGALNPTLDQQNNGGTASATSLQCSTLTTPGTSNQLILSLLISANAGTGFSPNGGFTVTNLITGAVGYEGGLAWLKQAPGPSSVNPLWSWTTATPASTVLATFKFT